MEPATLAAVPTAKPEVKLDGLVSKLLRAITEIQTIPKKGRNVFSNYDYARAEDIVAAVRGPLAKNGLLVYATLKERKSDEVRTAQGKPAWRERIVMTVTVTDGTASLSVDVPSEGTDTGEKSCFKAWTGGFKYALRTILLLPIADDVEVDSHETAGNGVRALTDARPTKPIQAVPAPREPQLVQPQPPIQRQAEPLATPKQVGAIGALSRAVGLTPELLAQVLRDSFGVESADALTRRQASSLLDRLKGEERYARSASVPHPPTD